MAGCSFREISIAHKMESMPDKTKILTGNPNESDLDTRVNSTSLETVNYSSYQMMDSNQASCLG